jgi:spore coat protein CotH
VENFINNCEQDLKKQDKAGYMQYLDIESMVDWYLNSELTKNPDASFFLSVYMNISADGKLYMGPLWDYDLSFGNQVYDDGNGSDNGYTGFTIRNGDRSKIWLPAMFNNPDFIALLKDKMKVIASNEAQIMAFIDKRHQELKKSAVFNDKRWNLMCPSGSSDETISKAYDKQINYIKEWLHGRIEWLGSNIDTL